VFDLAPVAPSPTAGQYASVTVPGVPLETYETDPQLLEETIADQTIECELYPQVSIEIVIEGNEAIRMGFCGSPERLGVAGETGMDVFDSGP
jgi:hypothetical protein